MEKRPGVIARSNQPILEALEEKAGCDGRLLAPVHLYHRGGFDFDPVTKAVYFDHEAINPNRQLIPATGWMTGDELKDFWVS